MDDVKISQGHCPNAFDCNFDSNTLCDYKNMQTNHFDWQIFKSFGPNSETSPNSDHTLGTGNGYYAMISK